MHTAYGVGEHGDRRAVAGGHLSSAIGKTGAANRAEAVLAAVENGWL